MNFRLNKDEVLSDLYHFVTAGNGILTGGPGVGKSYELDRLIGKLEDNDITTLYLPIDKLIAESNSELRDELDLDHNLIEYISSEQSVSSERPGIVIIDAFDAARSGKKRSFYLKLIHDVISKFGDEWNVLLTVREYDAKRSGELLNLFPKIKSDSDIKFQALVVSKNISCRHVILPNLTDNEIEIIIPPSISPDSSNVKLKALLQTPYNLSLFLELIENDADISKLNSVSSEVQLLDIYWNTKVEQEPAGVNHTNLLIDITQHMLMDHSLAIQSSDLKNQYDQEIWNYLLSNEIIVKVGLVNLNKIAYKHNILFDYAVARLAIDGDEDGLNTFLTKDKSNVIFLRPSIHYYFTKLWYENKVVFRQILLNWYNLDEDRISLIAKIIPVNVLILEANSDDDLEFLYAHYLEDEKSCKELLRTIIQTLIVYTNEKTSSYSINYDLWLHFSEYFIKEIKTFVELNFGGLIYSIQKKISEFEVQQKVGEISRRTLEISFKSRNEDKMLDNFAASNATSLVVKTFGTAPKESKKILQKIIQIIEEENFEIRYLFSIVYDIRSIFLYDPEFVSQIYRIVFSLDGDKNVQTEMGGSTFIRFTSNRKQDIEGLRYHLGEEAGKFIETDLKFGLKSFLLAINRAVCREHIVPYLREGYSILDRIQKFNFYKGESKFLPDLNYIWSDSLYRREPEFKIQNEIRNKILKEISETSYEKSLPIILDQYRDHAVVAILWKELIKIISSNPQIFSSVLLDICCAAPLQFNDETLDEIGELIEASVEILSVDDFNKIENSIVATYDTIEDVEYKLYRQPKRDYLLSKIPIKYLQSQEVIASVNEYNQNYSKPPRKPVVMGETKIGFPSEDEILSARGIDSKSEENRKIIPIIKKIARFNDEWRNEKAPEIELYSIYDQFKTVFNLINNPNSTVQKETYEYAWYELSKCAEIYASSVKDPESDLFKFSKIVLLQAAQLTIPEEQDDGYEPDFDVSSWSPTVRTNAAEGLIRLFALKEDAEIWSSITELLSDKSPLIRNIIAAISISLFKKSPDNYWYLIDHFIKNEENYDIYTTICRNLQRLGLSKKEVEERFEQIWEKSKISGFESINLINNSYFIISVSYYAFCKEKKWAKTVYSDFINKPDLYFKIRSDVVLQVINQFFKEKNILNSTFDKGRSNLSKWLKELVEKIFAEFTELYLDYDESDLSQKEELSELNEVIDQYFTRIYFAVCTKYNNISEPDDAIKAVQKIYELEKNTISFILDKSLQLNVTFGLGGIELGYLLGIMDSFLCQYPEEVLKLTVKVLKIGNLVEYSSDVLGSREIKEFIEHLLSDHREILENKDSMDDFTELLDNYSKGRSPEALDFVLSLDLEYK